MRSGLLVLPLLTLACAASPSDVVGPQAPAPQLMDLFTTAPVAGEVLVLTAEDANPGDTVYFAYSLAGAGVGPSMNFFGGMRPDLAAPIKLFPGGGTDVADATGVASYAFPIPAAAPAGFEVSVQALARAGFLGGSSYGSNVVDLTVVESTDEAPEVTITEPPSDHVDWQDWYIWDGVDGLDFYVDVVFEVDAMDLEDGPLDGASVQWFVDGVNVGQGAAVPVRLRGDCFGAEFVVEVEVTDSDGNTTTATRNVGAFTIC